MEVGTDIHGAHCMNPNDFDDSSKFSFNCEICTYLYIPACPPCLAPDSPQSTSQPGPGQRCGCVLGGTNTKKSTELVFCCYDALSFFSKSVPLSLLSSFTKAGVLKVNPKTMWQLEKSIQTNNLQLSRHAKIFIFPNVLPRRKKRVQRLDRRHHTWLPQAIHFLTLPLFVPCQNTIDTISFSRASRCIWRMNLIGWVIVWKMSSCYHISHLV